MTHIITYDQLLVIFSSEFLKRNFNEYWQGTLLDFIDRISNETELRQLISIFNFACTRIRRSFSSIQPDLMDGLNIFIQDCEKELTKYTSIPKLIEAQEKESITLSKFDNPALYARHIASYMRAYMPLHKIRSFKQENQRQLKSIKLAMNKAFG